MLSETRRNTDNAIAGGTVNIDGLNPGYKNELGSGRIDMFSAVQSVK